MSGRRAVLNDAAKAQPVVDQFLIAARQFDLEVIAYCAVLDHFHGLVRGLSAPSDFRAFMKTWKPKSGYEWKQKYGERLWQSGYHERVLRQSDSPAAFVKYIQENLIRSPGAAGL